MLLQPGIVLRRLAPGKGGGPMAFGRRRSAGPRQVLVVAAAGCLMTGAVGCGAASGHPPSSAGARSASSRSRGDLPSDAFTRTAQTALERARAGYGSPGALAVVQDGARQWAVATGSARIGGPPVVPQMRFRAASITKPFVATLVLDLVARGRTSLDERVDAVLPGVLHAGEAFTVRQLLDHTSGLYDELNGDDVVADIPHLPDPGMRGEARSLMGRYRAGEPVIAPAALLLALAETHRPYFAPGQGYHYSNMNYLVAGMLVEHLTHQPLAQVLHDRITGPEGLGGTTLAPPDLSPPDLHGYQYPDGGGPAKDVTGDLALFGNGGAAGLVTTAADLITFFRDLLAGRLLPAALLTQMTTPTPASAAVSMLDGAVGDSLGLERYQLSCGAFYGHSGSVDGTISLALTDAHGRRSVALAFNAHLPAPPELPELADTLACTPAPGPNGR